MTNSRFNKADFHDIIDGLARQDTHLARIIANHGYPPLWARPNSFSTLVLIILEQQVSLASAFAAYRMLVAKIGDITPAKLLSLTDEELRACYFSRQKTGYVRALAKALMSGELNLETLAEQSEPVIRTQLKKINGIGDWTVDVYLIFVLQHADHFPTGDIALMNSLRYEKAIDASLPRGVLLEIAEAWRPYRTIAAMILWHAYIERKGMKGPGMP